MLYTDTNFLELFALVWLVVKLLRPWPAIKEWFLIAVSFLVIASWGYFDLALFLIVLSFNFAAAVLISRSDNGVGRRILIGAIALDVATLAVFKYSNFVGQNIAAVIGHKFPDFPLGIPLAISFYTFHLISYLVDLHARRVKLASVRGYVFYLSFFPHVIAGPITRAWQLVPQVGKTRRIRTDFTMGFHFLVTGFFLKVVIANNIAAAIDPLWVDTPITPLENWIVAFLYYCQIYGDFAGYSLMALGMARLLGYRLPANFRSPMRAGSIRDFWQRWHITLSRWLRDYLYIPMGGNRVSPSRSAQNVLVTMFLGGLWHGASWRFAVWGLMHGGGLVAERYLGFDRKVASPYARFVWFLLAQIWITLAWVIFRVPSVNKGIHFILQMGKIILPHNDHARPMLLFYLLFAVPVIIHNCFPLILKAAGRRRLGLLLGISTALMLLLNLIVSSPSVTFIYFRF